jgi:hypothetical protein
MNFILFEEAQCIGFCKRIRICSFFLIRKWTFFLGTKLDILGQFPGLFCGMPPSADLLKVLPAG